MPWCLKTNTRARDIHRLEPEIKLSLPLKTNKKRQDRICRMACEIKNGLEIGGQRLPA